MEEVLWKLSRKHSVGSLLIVPFCTFGDTWVIQKRLHLPLFVTH